MATSCVPQGTARRNPAASHLGVYTAHRVGNSPFFHYTWQSEAGTLLAWPPGRCTCPARTTLSTSQRADGHLSSERTEQAYSSWGSQSGSEPQTWNLDVYFSHISLVPEVAPGIPCQPHEVTNCFLSQEPGTPSSLLHGSQSHEHLSHLLLLPSYVSRELG